MGLIDIPNRPAGSDIRSIADILADFDAILAVVNGGIESTNIANSAITLAKLAPETLNNFLKLMTSADVKLKFGAVGIGWPGGQAISNVVALAHGLGGLPIGHIFYPVDGSGTGSLWAISGQQDANNISSQFLTQGFQPSAGTHGTAFWMAIR